MALLGIALAVAAAFGNNIGKGLQKRAMAQLPQLQPRAGVVWLYLQNRAFLGGLALDVAGAVVMLAALAVEKVSVVQPVAAGGVVMLAVFAQVVLRERLQPREWAGLAAVVAGTVLAGAEDTPEGNGAAERGPAALRPAQAGVLLANLGVAVALFEWLLRKRGGGGGIGGAAGGAGPSRSGEFLAGLQSGLCFGLSAGVARAGLLAAQAVGSTWPAAAGVAGSTGLTGAGLFIQTSSLKHGRAVVVVTLANVFSIVGGMLFGVVALGEQFPQQPGPLAVRLASLALIVGGIVGVAGTGAGAAQREHGAGEAAA
eukprot:TRINITY_DN2927_c0_g1_i2.p3 TRINITY_DN2927_c0_g1~~TRINITY_DN2927_c0_g1_i2.p3  ORF type:complete len:313 (-),score=91.32 TRINITY_DN2927_c0_g1_i2:2-940(-)